MSKFPERLKELRNEKGLSKEQLSKETGISRPSISLYEVGKRVPSIEVAAVLADYFNVSMDFLVGRVD